jgi:hypothetical protein
VTSEAQGFVPLTQPNILIACNPGTVSYFAVIVGSYVSRELYIGQVFMKHALLKIIY